MTGSQLLIVPCPECDLDDPEVGAFLSCRTCTEVVRRRRQVPARDEEPIDRYTAYEAAADRIEDLVTGLGGRWP